MVACARCGKPGEDAWIACPFCGAPRLKPADDTPSQEVLARSWQLRGLLDSVMERAFAPVITEIGVAETLSAVLRARDATRLLGAVGRGLDAIFALAANQTLPPPFRSAIRQGAARRAELLASLSPPAEAVRRTADAVRDLKLPEDGAGGFVHGAARAANPTQAAGQGALGGAAIGAIFGPIGIAVGGAVGAMVGSGRDEERERAVLEASDTAATAFFAAVDHMVGQLWTGVAESATVAGYHLVPESTVVAAEEAWQAASNGLTTAFERGDLVTARGAVDGMISRWGPYPQALVRAIRGWLDSPDAPPEAVADLVVAVITTRPYDPVAWELGADHALATGDISTARQRVNHGLALPDPSIGLRWSHVETLAAEGRLEEAEAAATTPPVEANIGLLYAARGRVRAGDGAGAARLVARALAQMSTPDRARRTLRADSLLGSLWAGGLLPPMDQVSELRAIVEEHLQPDGEKAFVGDAPTEKVGNARSAGYLATGRGRTLLYLFDWSVWGNAKTGLAIATDAVAWKLLWEDPVRVELSTVTTPILATGSTLSIGGHSVDVDDEALAASLAAALSEMVAVIRG